MVAPRPLDGVAYLDAITELYEPRLGVDPCPLLGLRVDLRKYVGRIRERVDEPLLPIRLFLDQALKLITNQLPVDAHHVESFSESSGQYSESGYDGLFGFEFNERVPREFVGALAAQLDPVITPEQGEEQLIHAVSEPTNGPAVREIHRCVAAHGETVSGRRRPPITVEPRPRRRSTVWCKSTRDRRRTIS